MQNFLKNCPKLKIFHWILNIFWKFSSLKKRDIFPFSNVKIPPPSLTGHPIRETLYKLLEYFMNMYSPQIRWTLVGSKPGWMTFFSLASELTPKQCMCKFYSLKYFPKINRKSNSNNPFCQAYRISSISDHGGVVYDPE